MEKSLQRIQKDVGVEEELDVYRVVIVVIEERVEAVGEELVQQSVSGTNVKADEKSDADKVRDRKRRQLEQHLVLSVQRRFCKVRALVLLEEPLLQDPDTEENRKPEDDGDDLENYIEQGMVPNVADIENYKVFGVGFVENLAVFIVN